MAEAEEEKIATVFIPSNIQEGLDLGGLSLNPKRLLEGIIGGALGGFLMFELFSFLGRYFKIGIETEIVFIILAVGLLALAGYAGANNETFSQFIYHLFQFKRSKRIAYYNPRVKTEIKSVSESTDVSEEQLLPRDKIQKFIDNYQFNASRKTAQRIAETEQTHKAEGRMYFEDDVGVVLPPDAYMTKSEKKKLAKAQKNKTKKKSKSGKTKKGRKR